jgi:hypothetical protein
LPRAGGKRTGTHQRPGLRQRIPARSRGPEADPHVQPVAETAIAGVSETMLRRPRRSYQDSNSRTSCPLLAMVDAARQGKCAERKHTCGGLDVPREEKPPGRHGGQRRMGPRAPGGGSGEAGYGSSAAACQERRSSHAAPRAQNARLGGPTGRAHTPGPARQRRSQGLGPAVLGSAAARARQATAPALAQAGRHRGACGCCQRGSGSCPQSQEAGGHDLGRFTARGTLSAPCHRRAVRVRIRVPSAGFSLQSRRRSGRSSR